MSRLAPRRPDDPPAPPPPRRPASPYWGVARLAGWLGCALFTLGGCWGALRSGSRAEEGAVLLLTAASFVGAFALDRVTRYFDGTDA